MGNEKEHQLLAHLYKVEELLLELRSGGKDSEDWGQCSDHERCSRKSCHGRNTC